MDSRRTRTRDGRATRATFHLTHNCNLRCTYCFTGDKFGRGMTTETADAAVDFVLEQARAGAAHRAEVVFFGGEPLLRANLLFHIVERFSERAPDIACSFSMSTNGTLLDEALADRLAQARVFVSLSIDGPPDLHDAHRPDASGGGTAERVATAARLLLRRNPMTHATCVVMPASAGRVDEAVEWIHGLGVRYITTQFDYSAAWTLESVNDLERAWRRLATWYERRIEDGRPFYLGGFDGRIATRTQKPAADDGCDAAGSSFSVAPSGRLYPCMQFVRDDDEAAAGEFGIGDVVRGFDAAARARLTSCATKNARQECGGCALLDRCASHCACVNYLAGRRVDAASPVVCETERRLFPIVDATADRMWKRRSRRFAERFYDPDFPVANYLEEVLFAQREEAPAP